MIDLFRIMRLALYVVALPLAVTAVVSAESLLSVQDGIIDDSELAASSTSAPVALDADTGQVNHVLHIDSDGGVTGRVMNRSDVGFDGAMDMNVSLNLQGEVVASATTGADGVFRFENVPPGAYSFIATSPENITTFGVYVFDSATPAGNEVQFSVAATSSNTSNVREILNSEIQTVSYNYTPSENEVTVKQEISQVELDGDGAMNGRISPLRWEDQEQTYDLTGNQVYLIDASGVVANAPVNADGSYSLPGVSPGVYDFVSFGPHGAAALSIEVIGDNSVASNQANTEFASTSSPTALQGFDVVLSEPVS